MIRALAMDQQSEVYTLENSYKTKNEKYKKYNASLELQITQQTQTYNHESNISQQQEIMESEM